MKMKSASEINIGENNKITREDDLQVGVRSTSQKKYDHERDILTSAESHNRHMSMRPDINTKAK